jgi:hypothetical protein
MRGIKKGEWASKPWRMAGYTEISRAVLRYPAGFETVTGLRTHVGVGVRRHVIPEVAWSLFYDVSEKHSVTNLHLT